MDATLKTLCDLMCFLHPEKWFIVIQTRPDAGSNHVEVVTERNLRLYEADDASLEVALARIVATVQYAAGVQLAVLDKATAAVTAKARETIATIIIAAAKPNAVTAVVGDAAPAPMVDAKL